MTRILPIVTERKYPLRYWMMAVYAAGVPNFVKFDDTGLTHKQGLFNATSVSGIALLFLITVALSAITLLNRQRIIARKIDYCAWVWVALLVELTLATVLGPPNRLQPSSHVDLMVGLFRLFGWVIALVLLLSLYSREPAESAADLIVRLVAFVAWINIALIWIALPLIPSLALAAPPDLGEGNRRLGGLMIHPLGLSLCAEIAFFHALIFFRGWRQWALCLFAFVTLALTYARSAEVSFLVLLFLYLFFLARRRSYRWLGLLMLIVACLAAVGFSGQILSYAARGNGVNNIATLSERTYVWQASIQAFELRPFIGHGFVNGVRNALRDQWKFTHWIPPEAHNEIMQALVSGGIPAGLLVLFLYLQTLWKGFRTYSHGPKQTFMVIVLIQLTIMSIGEPLITVAFGRSGALFLLVFVGITGGYRAIRKSKRRALKAAPAFQHPMEQLTGV